MKVLGAPMIHLLDVLAPEPSRPLIPSYGFVTRHPTRVLLTSYSDLYHTIPGKWFIHTFKSEERPQ